MKQFVTTVASNTLLCESMRQLDFSIEAGTETPRPGQFFTVRIINSISPLLRRPFAFSAFDEHQSRASCIYQIRGGGTELLGTIATGVPLDIIGPLGKPFPFPAPHEKPLLIAGGIGLGPILFLAKQLLAGGVGCQLIFGCRSADWFPVSAFDGMQAIVCTDDGSSGFHGTVVRYLESVSARLDANTVLYCCGPHPMLKGCHSFATDRGMRCVVSVEQTMACGVGACMGCAVKVRGAQQYARACKEGPVFESGDLVWE